MQVRKETVKKMKIGQNINTRIRKVEDEKETQEEEEKGEKDIKI